MESLSDKIERAVSSIRSLGDEKIRFKIFQQLPLPLRMEVLKGRVLYEDETPFMYDKAYETVKEFESFKPRYYDYMGIEPLA